MLLKGFELATSDVDVYIYLPTSDPPQKIIDSFLTPDHLTLFTTAYMYAAIDS